jgi:regulator of sigma D
MTEEAFARRSQTRERVDHMLREREEMLVLLWKLSGRGGKHDPEEEPLRRFLSILVDYIASAHFGLYQRLTEGTERRQAVIRAAAQLYPRIVQSTDAAVAFNDKYSKKRNAHKARGLKRDLSALAEVLAERIRLEDQIIEAMLGRPATAPAS